MINMTGADALAATLEQYDVELVIGYAGHSTFGASLAVARSGKYRTLYPVTEMGGAYMLHGYNLLRGRSAAVGLWHTVGSLLTSPAVMEGYIARVPTVHIGMNADTGSKDRQAMQDIPNEGVFRDITTWTTRVERPDKLPEAIHHGFQHAHSARRGPVMIDVPFDLMVDEAPISIPSGWRPPTSAARPTETDVRRVVELLENAERPIVLAGGGAAGARAGDAIRELAELLDMPVAVTSTGRGLIPDDHPLCAGLTGTVASDVANAAVREADVVLVIGSRLSEWGYAQGYHAELPGALIQIDSDPVRIGDFYFPEVGIVGDAATVVQEILAAMRGAPAVVARSGARPWASEIAERKAALDRELAELAASDQAPLSPWRIVAGVREAIDDDTIVVTDVGSNTGYTFRGLLVRRPQRLLAPYGVGSLGSAYPMALGAKLAEPDTDVIVITGDGGFQYTLNEIATGLREHLPVTIVVLNDGYLNSARHNQEACYGDSVWSTLHNPDFVALARAYGAEGERVERPADVADAVRRAIASKTTYVLDVATEPSFGYPATGAGPVPVWEPRTWPGALDGVASPGLTPSAGA